MRSRSRGLVVLVGLGAATLAMSLPSCAPGADYRRKLFSPYPLDRARATKQAAEAGDVAAVHKLVDLLDDPQAAVRLYAILALKKLVGTDYGYKYYESEPGRAAAVARWRQALRDGQIVVRRGAKAPEAPGNGPAGSPAASGSDPAGLPAAGTVAVGRDGQGGRAP